MIEKRVNPDTGILEEKHWHGWTPSRSADDNERRVNPDTGVHEEKLWHGWTPSRNADGHEQRVNPDNGIHEEKAWHGWTPSRSDDDNERRVNPGTGVHEEKLWHGWTPIRGSNENERRVNPDTGVHEEKAWHGWTPSEPAASGMPRRSRHGHNTDSSRSSSGLGHSPQESSDWDASYSGGNVNGESSASGGSIVVLIILVCVGIAMFASSDKNSDENINRRTVAVPAPVAPPVKREPVYASYAPATDMDRILGGLQGSMTVAGHLDGDCRNCKARLRIFKKDLGSLKQGEGSSFKCPACHAVFTYTPPYGL